MEGLDAMFNDYPTMAAEVFNALFSVDGRPQEPLRRRIMPHYQEARAFQDRQRGEEGGERAVSQIALITVNVSTKPPP